MEQTVKLHVVPIVLGVTQTGREGLLAGRKEENKGMIAVTVSHTIVTLSGETYCKLRKTQTVCWPEVGNKKIEDSVKRTQKCFFSYTEQGVF